MSDPRMELKARVLAKAEVVIDEVLASRRPPGEVKLADIEQSALRVGQQMAHALTAELVAESGAAVSAWPNCSRCGRRMRVTGQRRRVVVVETGEVTVERAYYHCAACQTGVFPPG